MDSRRQLKIASLIKEALAEILNKGGSKIYGKALVTVTNAKVTSDLTLVRFYLSVFNAEDADAVVDKFSEHKFELKKALAEKLRHQIRRIPEIEFFKDDTLDYVFHMEEVFKKIKEDDELLKLELENNKTAGKKTKPAAAKPARKPTRKK